MSTSGDSQYNLEFVDGDGNKVSVPIAKSPTGSAVLHGDTNKPFINVENWTISKDAYIVVTDSTRKRGERKTYILQYKGADKVGADNPVIKFKDLGSGDSIDQTWSNVSSTIVGPDGTNWNEFATLKIGGADHKIYAGPLTTSNDFGLIVDLDGSGSITLSPSGVDLGANIVNITTKFGAEIGVTNLTNSSQSSTGIILSIKTPDESRDGSAKDSVDTLQATDYVVNITAASGEVAHAESTGTTAGQKGTKLSLRTPSGENNVAYGYTSYGTWIQRDTPTSSPQTLDIKYPESQRLPQVYITAKGASFTESAAGEGDAVTIQKIDVGATKLASEVADINAVNSILVGGPCANAAAAKVMGNPADCTAGFEPGVGKINLYEVGTGNVAMLVAGYAALDTRNAAQVVANYKKYTGQLKGTAVEVKKVNNQLTVAAPVPAAAMPAEESTTTETVTP